MRTRAVFLALLLLLPACRQDMARQPKYAKPLQPSDLFADGRSARPLIDDTVARRSVAEEFREDLHLTTGRSGDEFAETFPFEITEERLQRGRQRFDIFCAVCHDRLGGGEGKIVQRGFTRPPTFYPIPEKKQEGLSRGFRLHGYKVHGKETREMPLTEAPVGYFFFVMTNGFGAMPDYAAQVPPEDRWAITAYIRVLQLSQRPPAGAALPAGRAANLVGD
jgi:hypothetical protein